ncbi:MAG TPA: CehA/McbA family metallohydrolase [Polyangiaceae bacterium]|nr:CehA/McbA family metallohydrolase [Polyangiaceae bacterium]
MRPLVVILIAVALAPVGTAAALEWSEHEHVAPLAPARSAPWHFERSFDVSDFKKGNLHTHTNRSDGDSAPEDVASWYRRSGYNFLALTDHNRFNDARRWAWLENEDFRLISGEEITMSGGGRQVHVNALCTSQKIGGGTFDTVAAALSWAVSRVERQGGVAIVNHPNFDRAISATDLPAADGAALFEIMSGHPYVYSAGTKNRPSAEHLWDVALTDGQLFAGVAVDDMHHLRTTADPPAFAGKGWVEVFATANDPATICDALRKGALYASSGASFSRIRVTATTYTVWPERGGSAVSFIGVEGRTLLRTTTVDDGEPATYVLGGGEVYVRANVTAPDGTHAWAPAVFVRR